MQETVLDGGVSTEKEEVEVIVMMDTTDELPSAAGTAASSGDAAADVAAPMQVRTIPARASPAVEEPTVKEVEKKRRGRDRAPGA